MFVRILTNNTTREHYETIVTKDIGGAHSIGDQIDRVSVVGDVLEGSADEDVGVLASPVGDQLLQQIPVHLAVRDHHGVDVASAQLVDGVTYLITPRRASEFLADLIAAHHDDDLVRVPASVTLAADVEGVPQGVQRRPRVGGHLLVLPNRVQVGRDGVEDIPAIVIVGVEAESPILSVLIGHPGDVDSFSDRDEVTWTAARGVLGSDLHSVDDLAHQVPHPVPRVLVQRSDGRQERQIDVFVAISIY